ncbi:MAG: hypothetical protein RMJ51_02400 [Candidatus Calescibacterium sp.]|nr:hypothetical protein [Candidatus Calescibacterium sp.]MCX7972319.1 hypothetical protein [bacterium]MDW8195077.1 hypothetical protein [Candidatus Calescibacterium sp.]
MNNYPTDNFVLLIQKLKEPFDKMSTYMTHAPFFNIMKLNFEILAEQVASRYLKDRNAYGGSLPPDMEQQYCNTLLDSLREGNLKVLDYISWLEQVIYYLENEQPISFEWEEFFKWE